MNEHGYLLTMGAGAGIGAGALKLGMWTSRRIDAWKRRLAEEYGKETRSEEELAIGRLALVTRRALKPDLDKLDLIQKRLSGIEKELYKLTVAAMEAQRVASQISLTSNEEPKPEAAYTWRNDEAARGVAREVVESLMKMQGGPNKAAAEAMVARALERQRGPGIKHDELFTEAFKK